MSLSVPDGKITTIIGPNGCGKSTLLRALARLKRPDAGTVILDPPRTGLSKAALEQVSAVLGAEHPDVRVLAVDPGDMRTEMHQDAFPDDDISDRPLPDDSVPGVVALVEGDQPSGRYQAKEVA